MHMRFKTVANDDLNGRRDETTEIIGELRFRNTFRVDGRIKGKVVSQAALIVGEKATIDADLDCGTVSIRGRVNGHVTGRERIEVLAGAQVRGHLSSPRLIIEEGAFFEGECDMGAPPMKGEVIRLPQPPRQA
jgi:cytoskeletal protein CcmA (bactofilin family)